MGYSDTDGLKTSIGEEVLQELVRDSDTGAFPTAAEQEVIDLSISKSDEFIDAYLAERYPVPFTSVPELIEKISLDLTEWNLRARRNAQTEECDAKRSGWIELLERIAAGEAAIPGISEADTTGGEPVVGGNEPLFTRETMEGF